MPDTFFTKSPHWGWWAVSEFFIAGIAGAAAAIAALLWLFGSRDDRFIARYGFAVATVGSALSGLLLTLDLKRPERFWHMLLFSKTLGPTFQKWWAPMADGAWALFLLGGFSFLTLVGSLADRGPLPSGLAFLARGVLGTVLAALAGIAGVFYAGYKGVLLSATNRPLWGDTPWLGILLLASGFAMASALLLLLTRDRSPAVSQWLRNLMAGSLALTLLVVVILAATLDADVRRLVLQNVYGVLLVVAVLLGTLVPLALAWRPRLLGRLTLPSAAVLVLVGGFLLRMAMLLSSEAA
ncbi:polysulfide reductase NrfD [Thermomicrobiaceae bacterium CFH 74404]|uniref:Polysulfide reductase NrfD n=1 Tax=Thermalbibacter longus TaxID=2951981 RepID=A0AA42BBN4_9BACT|nr:NrfD/PsrC family molybdoenzyme membrane anchor subunit [Thermalbibacter longus]MCM8749940.1 polysulfide reductase NrfD [Thermalbibacter longus]